MKSSEDLYKVFPAWLSQQGPDQDVVLYSRLSLNRNANDYPFPHRQSTQGLSKFLARCHKAAQDIYSEYQVINITPELENLYYEEFYLLRDNSEKISGHQIYIADHSALLINSGNHFSLIDIAPGLDLKGQHSFLEKQDSILEKHFTYAVSIDWGYLLSRVDRTGSGLQLDIFLHLPALSKQSYFEKLISRALNNNCSIRSFGTEDSPLGDIFQLATHSLLGTKEEETIANLESIVKEFVHFEREARTGMLKIAQSQFVDQVWRDLAILQNSRLLGLREALSRISTVRVGSCLGILPVSPIPAPFILSQTGHLKILSQFFEDRKDNDQLRASIMRSIFGLMNL